MDEIYNQLDVDKDNDEFKSIFDNYFKDRILLLEEGYVGDTLE